MQNAIRECPKCGAPFDAAFDPQNAACPYCGSPLSEENASAAAEAENDRVLFLSIADLSLSVRCYNTLYRAGLYTVSDLVQQTRASLLAVRGMNAHCMNEVTEKLAQYDLTLKD